MSAECAPDGGLAPALSPAEWDEVVRFGLDKPGADDVVEVEEPKAVDDVEGMTFGVRLAFFALLIASVGGMGALLISVGLFLLGVPR